MFYPSAITSEINLQSHAGRLKPEGTGVVSNNQDLGFFMHPTLVVNAETGFPLGLSHVQIWTRALNHPDKHQRRYRTLPIEQKESYKWLQSASASQRCLSLGGARQVTHIGDRESDLYEQWATVPDANHHVLVRVRQDRRLLAQDAWLYAHLEQQPCEGTYAVEVVADPRSGRRAREAWLSVRIARVQIRRGAIKSGRQGLKGLKS